jgi:hypothetical protein
LVASALSGWLSTAINFVTIPLTSRPEPTPGEANVPVELIVDAMMFSVTINFLYYIIDNSTEN